MNSSIRISPGGIGLSLFAVFMLFLSVVIHDFDLMGITGFPREAHPPLVVDPDAVLALAAALQGFEVVAWGRLQVLERASPVQVQEFPTGSPLDGLEPPDRNVVEEGLDILVAKGANHDSSLLRMT
jgi:hypothetical protein